MTILHDLNVDLHTHSKASDGSLSPSEVMERALSNDVDIVALTDHDTIEGVHEAMQYTEGKNIYFIPGVEISTSWAGVCIHVLGLNINPNDEQLKKSLSKIQDSRYTRAQLMDKDLTDKGFPSVIKDALEFAGGTGQVGRAHFARALIKKELCEDMREVFNKFLIKGKPGFVDHQWPSLKSVMEIIKKSKGLGVIAHPARYRLNYSMLTCLLEEFQELGGVGLEVSTGSHSALDIENFKRITNDFRFEGSRGSDFHCPNESRYDVGKAPYLPDSLLPIWSRWKAERVF